MISNTPQHPERDTIIIVGGRGGLQARYREVVEAIGYRCRCYEDRVAAKCGPSAGKIALVIVLVTMVSHPLLMRARELAGEQQRIVYLKSPSVSSVRQTVEAITQGTAPVIAVKQANFATPNARG